MKNFWVNVSISFAVVLISVGVSYATLDYLNTHESQSLGYAKNFDQKNLHLSSFTADSYPYLTKAAGNSVHTIIHTKSIVKPRSLSLQSQGQMIDFFKFFFGDREGDNNYNAPLSSVRFGLGRNGDMVIQSFNQTDVAINSNNTSCALANKNEELVGVNTAIYSQTADFAGYSFAETTPIASKIVNGIKEDGAVQRAVLGVLVNEVSVAKEQG